MYPTLLWKPKYLLHPCFSLPFVVLIFVSWMALFKTIDSQSWLQNTLSHHGTRHIVPPASWSFIFRSSYSSTRNMYQAGHFSGPIPGLPNGPRSQVNTRSRELILLASSTSRLLSQYHPVGGVPGTLYHCLVCFHHFITPRYRMYENWLLIISTTGSLSRQSWFHRPPVCLRCLLACWLTRPFALPATIMALACLVKYGLYILTTCMDCIASMAIITRSQSKPVRRVTATDLGWLDPPHYKTYQDQFRRRLSSLQ